MGFKSNAAAALVGITLLGGAGIASAATSGGSTTPAPTASSAPRNPSCRGAHDGEWPDVFNGRPAQLDAGDPGGVYLWHDSAGWHLRVTHVGHDDHVYAGVITTPGTLTAQRVKDEQNDKVVVAPDGHELYFRFVNYGYIDGVDFQTKCTPRLNFDFRSGDDSGMHQLANERIFLGHADANPTSNPFVAERLS